MSALRTIALAGAASLALAAPVRAAGVPAAGGEPLLAAAETARATVVGRVAAPVQVDRHAWAAPLDVERVLAGAIEPGTTLRIAWEELGRGRPVRFRENQRIVVALEPLPSASLWRARFPASDALAVAARGEAFLREPDAASLDGLERFLALPAEARGQEPGVEALAALAARAQPALARAALGRLARVPGLDGRLSADASEQLARAATSTTRPLELRRDTLALVEERRLHTLRGAIEPLAAAPSPLQAPALAALARLDGGLSDARIAQLLASDDPALRAVAVREAPGTTSAAALPRMLRRDRAAEVRAACVRALLAERGADAVGPVGEALFDPDAAVREAAVLGLAGLGDAAVPALAQLVEHRAPDEVASPLAALALAGTSGRHALSKIAETHQDGRVRALARAMLGREPQPHH